MANEQTASNSGSNPLIEDEHIFFNVLPAERSDGGLANPGSAGPSVPSLTSESTSSSVGFVAKIRSLTHGANMKLMGIIAAAIVILGIGGFFAYRFLTAPADPVAEPAPVTETEPEPVDSTPAQPEGVTTPTDWQSRYFGAEICENVTVCGDTSDPDRDGLSNTEEYASGTDPNNADSNGGGLADGDKVHVFGSDPLKVKSKDGPYTDADYAKYGYDLTTDQPYTAEKLTELVAKIRQYGLHQPTIATLGEEALKYYQFTSLDPVSSGDPLEGLDRSSSAQLDRDTQRLNTVKKIGTALLQYKEQTGSFPNTAEFNDVVSAVKPYITVATNYSDPINKDKYVYGYIAENNGADFTLTYFSETQNLLLKYKSVDAQKDTASELSNGFDDQRRRDLDNLRTALLLYSSHNADSHSAQQFVFPPVDSYKTQLISGNYITQIPVDPRTNQDYSYEVSEKFDAFILKAVLDEPAPGTTGIVCTHDQECKNY